MPLELLLSRALALCWFAEKKDQHHVTPPASQDSPFCVIRNSALIHRHGVRVRNQCFYGSWKSEPLVKFSHAHRISVSTDDRVLTLMGGFERLH